MALHKLLLYLSAITIATLFNGSAHGAAARELQSALANWDISFVTLTANFNQNNDGDGIVSTFEIGKNQLFDVEIFAADCTTPIAAGNGGTSDDVISLNGDPTRTNKDDNHDVLRIAHTITKGALVGSNVWNGETNKLEICQKTKLVIKVNGDSANDIVVVEDRRKFVVNLDLTMDFEVNSTLRAENQPMSMIVFNATLAVEGLEEPSDSRTLYHAADLLARSMVELVGEAPWPNRGEVRGVIPLAMNFPPTELLDLPNPLPDWKAMPQMRRGMLSITDRSDPKEEGEEADAPLGGERTLQASNSSTVKFEVTLMEPCDNETHCYELRNTTTFYSDVTTYMDQEIESGRFATLLQENVAKYPLTRRLVNEMAQQDDVLAEKEGGIQEEESDALASVDSFDIIMNQNHGQRKLSISTANVTGATFSSPVMTMEMNEGQVFNASGSTDVISYVKACKCGGWESFTCNSDVLEEDGELNICISSIRASEVETDFIESMVSWLLGLPFCLDSTDLHRLIGNCVMSLLYSSEYQSSRPGIPRCHQKHKC